MSILLYNTHSVSRVFSDSREDIFSEHLAPNARGVFSTYQRLGLNKNCIVDRTGSLPHYLKVSTAHKMPTSKGFSQSFNEVAEARAKELVNLGKPIKVLWSGGIDSTYALFMLNQYAAKGQVTAYGTYMSVIEAGKVFDQHIKNRIPFELVISPNAGSKRQTDDSLWVTGFQGNQLFGPTDDFFASDRSTALFHHTLGTKETIYEPYERHVDPDVLAFLQPCLEQSPRKLETVNDLRWYCIFNLDWHTGLYEVMSEMSPERMDAVHHFFDTEDFQRWAITTKEPFTKVRGKPNTHRWQMRERLADFGLTEYAWSKGKTISTFSAPMFRWLFLLEDRTQVYL